MHARLLLVMSSGTACTLLGTCAFCKLIYVAIDLLYQVQRLHLLVVLPQCM